MYINVAWDDDAHTIIRYDLPTEWRWDDFDDARARMRALLDTVDYPVAMILHATHDTRLPADFLLQARQRMRGRDPRTYVIVNVGANAFIRTIFDVYQRLRAGDDDSEYLRLVETLDEARALIAELAIEREQR